MKPEPVEIGLKMNALGIWDVIAPFNWAIKPRGTAFPYFCSVLKGDGVTVRYRFLLLEGWQTLHDYVRSRIDVNFGCFSTPAEMPHFELVFLADGKVRIFRHDPCYFPLPVVARAQLELLSRMLWESYGVMLRIEADRTLPMKFADDRAIFARVEGADDSWRDEPLQIPDPRPIVEQVAFDKTDLKAAADLPLASDDAVSVDFRIIPALQTREARPRSVYELLIADDKTGQRLEEIRASADPESGLKGLWEAMPCQFLKAIIRHGRIPGSVKVRSGRVFRFLRPLCLDLPFKLSLHDKVDSLPA